MITQVDDFNHLFLSIAGAVVFGVFLSSTWLIINRFSYFVWEMASSKERSIQSIWCFYVAILVFGFSVIGSALYALAKLDRISRKSGYDHLNTVIVLSVFVLALIFMWKQGWFRPGLPNSVAKLAQKPPAAKIKSNSLD